MLLLLALTTSIALAGDEVYAASVSVLLPCLRGEEGRRELKEEEERCGGGERGLAGACFAVPRARAAFPCFVDALCLLEMGIVEQRKHTDCICEAEKDRCCDIIIAPIE
jgi:hypothetical protein